MARKKASPPPTLRERLAHRIRRLVLWFWRIFGLAVLLVVAWVALYRWVDPPVTPYMISERRNGLQIQQTWTAMDQIAPVMGRSVVAAEDANFCLHWGFDMKAIRAALDEGANRGASTLTQQVVKNVFLWHGRSWLRKLLEAGLTPLVEALWTKERILEVYLNVAEFDEGVFGVGAAAPWYFGVAAADLTPRQAAQLAVVLPNPKDRSAKRPTAYLRRHAARVADGAATIRADGRSACFES